MAIATHSLARHLRREVNETVIKAIAETTPKYKPVAEKVNQKAVDGATATVAKATTDKTQGFWERDQIATKAATVAAGVEITDGYAASEPVTSLSSGTTPAPHVPLGLPSKLKERWNALYDPTSSSNAAKRAKKSLAAAAKGTHP